ncbi:MAG TPA: hypothetical protein DHU96_01560 [Actinobacteria bacterium]|nr:hypothetical protein [Actinomycetota bacterium]
MVSSGQHPGSFAARAGSTSPTNGNSAWNTWTSNPILVVGTRYDPATPYWGAGALTRELARGRLLTEQGYGHTALLNPSACINRYESDYFVSGALPPPGTVCHQDHQPFGLPGQP